MAQSVIVKYQPRQRFDLWLSLETISSGHLWLTRTESVNAERLELIRNAFIDNQLYD